MAEFYIDKPRCPQCGELADKSQELALADVALVVAADGGVTYSGAGTDYADPVPMNPAEYAAIIRHNREAGPHPGTSDAVLCGCPRGHSWWARSNTTGVADVAQRVRAARQLLRDRYATDTDGPAREADGYLSTCLDVLGEVDPAPPTDAPASADPASILRRDLERFFRDQLDAAPHDDQARDLLTRLSRLCSDVGGDERPVSFPMTARGLIRELQAVDPDARVVLHGVVHAGDGHAVLRDPSGPLQGVREDTDVDMVFLEAEMQSDELAERAPRERAEPGD